MTDHSPPTLGSPGHYRKVIDALARHPEDMLSVALDALEATTVITALHLVAFQLPDHPKVSPLLREQATYVFESLADHLGVEGK